MQRVCLSQQQFDGAVVGAEDVGVDFSVGNLGKQALGGDKVVDAPACIFLAGLEAVRPPGIGDLLWIECAERVDEAII